MLPELIYREEKVQDYSFLAFLGALSGFIGFALANFLFPSQVGLVTVVFAAIPLVYPLTQFFLEDESARRPHAPEIKVYLALFAGQVAAFTALGLMFPESFEIQISQFASQLEAFGASGYFFSDSLFFQVLSNNMVVFGSILVISVVLASSGAFVLTWNASVLGLFISSLLTELPNDISLLVGSESVPSPIAYLPHTAFEMTGFIIAGVAGSLISASIYRKHFDKELWIDYGKLVALGAGFILIGAILETA